MLENIKLLSDANNKITHVNGTISQINSLITEYHQAELRDKAEIILEIYQIFTDFDANISSNELYYDTDVQLEYMAHFYELLRNNLSAEFQALGLRTFSSIEINQWDIAQTRSDEAIPSPDRFYEMTEPGFWDRLMCRRSSAAVREAGQLLSEISDLSIQENSVKNYQKFTHLKRAIRVLLRDQEVSKADKKILREVIATLNGRVFDLLNHNPALQRELEPKDIRLMHSVGNANTNDVTRFVYYLAESDTFDDNVMHRDFDELMPGLDEFKVEFLGGENSKNYLITDLIEQDKYVLKIGHSLGNSNTTYERLTHTSVNANLNKTYVSRGRIADKLYSLEINEYCAHGDVLYYGRTITVPEKKLLAATEIYSEISQILLNFKANNAMFPDLKPTNFLITEDGAVVIDDSKSFVDAYGNMLDLHKVYEHQYFSYTVSMAPDFMKDPSDMLNVDKYHAYVLGFGLYLFLTDQKVPNARPPDSFFNFEHPIFNSDKGREYQALIQDLLVEYPTQRLGIQAAKQTLPAIQQAIKIERSSFKSRTEAYLFAINHLQILQKTHPHPHLLTTIEQLKIGMENHEKNPKMAANLLLATAKKMGKFLPETEVVMLKNIAHAITSSAYHQTAQEKFENPLARHFESQMQIELLQNPTHLMMESVKNVSDGLLNVFQQMEEQGMQVELDNFASSLTSGKQQTGFGSQLTPRNYVDIKQLLSQNDPKALNQIMFIQFLFAQTVMRVLPEEIKAPNPGMPTGKLKSIIQEYDGCSYRDNPAEFFENLDAEKLRLISNEKMYDSALYQAENGRGRVGSLPQTFSSQMGVMLIGQNEQSLPVDPSSWTPDSKYQQANLSSIYVRDLIENDAVYVAGPSGMTSLFLNIMEMYGNFSDPRDKQHYLAAVSAYMVSWGDA